MSRTRRPPGTTASAARIRSNPEAVVLPLELCPVCRYEHPKPKRAANGDSPFLNIVQTAGFLGLKPVTVYSERSRGHLPPVLPGRKSPCWDSCVLAVYLYENRIIGPTFP